MKKKCYLCLFILAVLLISCNQFTFRLFEDLLNKKEEKKKEVIIIEE